MYSRTMSYFKTFLILLLACQSSPTVSDDIPSKSCNELLMGQYICDNPEIDISIQRAANCEPVDDSNSRFETVVQCYPAPGVTCDGRIFDGSTDSFSKRVQCKPGSQKSFKTALLLSIFLGMFGIDRFYLGYPALGLLKLSTFGFMLVGQLIDIILIASQVVKPADGGEYTIDFYGPRLIQTISNSTSIT